MIRPSLPALDPFLEPLRVPGGFFDVEPCSMDLNLGRACRLVEPNCRANAVAWRVVAVQKDYRGVKCYRIVRRGMPVGMCAYTEDIRFVDAASDGGSR